MQVQSFCLIGQGATIISNGNADAAKNLHGADFNRLVVNSTNEGGWLFVGPDHRLGQTIRVLRRTAKHSLWAVLGHSHGAR